MSEKQWLRSQEATCGSSSYERMNLAQGHPPPIQYKFTRNVQYSPIRPGL
jgi:hypothetical protein